jgi:hypothetical protein
MKDCRGQTDAFQEKVEVRMEVDQGNKEAVADCYNYKLLMKATNVFNASPSDNMLGTIKE